MAKKYEIYVYAHWIGMNDPKLMGLLEAQSIKGRMSFSFEYDKDWLLSNDQLLLDPDISWFSGKQFPNTKGNFGLFMDSMPDTWGRTLMKRKAAISSKQNDVKSPILNEVDFLLGVYDESRMGALRFKLDKEGAFLDDSRQFLIPPWSSVRELQHSAKILDSDIDNKNVIDYLRLIMAPGSSLGGARPKANILDKNKHPWIAKFPSKNDEIDKAQWEYLAYKLALNSGIEMSESKCENIMGPFHTFFTKRFDRLHGERIHFASAMSMTGHSEDGLRDDTASYLELAEFIQFAGANVENDLSQLWRRIIFSIAISNTDDHLRNHGFILEKKGWRLSPAYDINPSIDKSGLALNIDMDSNALEFNLARSVGDYFLLNNVEMDKIIQEVSAVVSKWEIEAARIGISRKEIQLMNPAFRWE
ncbi:MAG: type II toxin-antitoxin system HipA family toxin [Bacteroidetes bacterium]|nr:MAG: type II toxin-antitoxin system HipA family toxin [Bacteroidota bacterium]